MREKIAVFDLDGTICDNDHRKHLAETKQWDAFNAACVYDKPRKAELALALAWVRNGGDIVYCTGRSADRMSETLWWMSEHNLPVGALLMRPRGDHRDDAVVKREILERHTSLENVAFVVEDRDRVVAMWRSLGLTCFQNQPGAF